MDEIIKDDQKDLGDIQIYELGYHILPNIPLEDVLVELAKIHTIISENDGIVIGEGLPNLRELAYEMRKRIETKNFRFNKAYFGWVKFEIDRLNILNIKNKVEGLPSILRSIIIKTVKENTMHTPKIPVFKKEVIKDEISFGLTEEVGKKIMEGKITAYFKERTLLEQEYIKDPTITIKELVDSATQKFGEKIEIARFARFSVS